MEAMNLIKKTNENQEKYECKRRIKTIKCANWNVIRSKKSKKNYDKLKNFNNEKSC